MSENFSFINNGKNESIDFDKLNNGLKKEDIAGKNKALRSIFDSVDTDNNKVLDKKELSIFKEMIKSIAKDNEISKEEAQEYQGKDGQKLGNLKYKNLFKFLDKLNSTTINVESVQSQNIDNQEANLITYKDGHTETVFPDGSKILTLKENGTTAETKLDKNGKKVKRTTANNSEGTIITEEFENKKVTKKIVEDNKQGTIEEYSPINGELQITKKTDLRRNTTINYKYKGNKIIGQKVDSEGNNLIKIEFVRENGNETTTEYEHNRKTIQSYTTKDKKILQVNYDESGNSIILAKKQETIKDIAQKFNCSEQEILNANHKKDGEVFESGEVIVIPKTIEAKDSDLDVKKEQNITETKKTKNITAQQKYTNEISTLEKRKTLFKKGPVYTDRMGNKYVLAPGANTNGKGRAVVINQKGEICIVSQGEHYKTQAEAQKNAKKASVMLKNDYAQNTRLFKLKKKIIINGKQYAIISKKPDIKGRKHVVDSKGHMLIISWDNKILKNSYAQKTKNKK